MPPTKVAKSKSPTTPPQEDARWKLLQGNCLDVLPTLPAMSIDSVVTDPPYELNFMGSKNSWDRTGIAFNEEMWRYVLRALKPGGHLLAFSGTRTYHRMACAIEDAGFEIRDQLAWTYGSGMPKSHDVSKGIDKMYGHQREQKVYQSKPGMAKSWDTGSGKGFSGTTAVVNDPISEEAETWNGWGSGLKPCWEPICLAMRPLDGNIQRNVREHGTGSLNIDGCRIGDSGGSTAERPSGVRQARHSVTGYQTSHKSLPINKGRWPGNICTDGSDEVLALFPKTGDESAARFFYCAKASARDRDEGLEDLHAKDAGSLQFRANGDFGDDIPQRKNVHTTVKPTSLMQWLVRLITPPGGTVLDPFTGSGSTGKACGFEGFRFVGIEMTEEYIEIALRRILFGYTNKPKK